MAAQTTTVSSAARVRKPRPTARPTDMAKKMNPMSQALPVALLKRIRPKAPSTTRPVPRLPLTSMMMTDSITGSTARITAKLLVCECELRYTSAMITPRTRAVSMVSSTVSSENEPVCMILVKSNMAFLLCSVPILQPMAHVLRRVKGMLFLSDQIPVLREGRHIERQLRKDLGEPVRRRVQDFCLLRIFYSRRYVPDLLL